MPTRSFATAGIHASRENHGIHGNPENREIPEMLLPGRSSVIRRREILAKWPLSLFGQAVVRVVRVGTETAPLFAMVVNLAMAETRGMVATREKPEMPETPERAERSGTEMLVRTVMVAMEMVATSETTGRREMDESPGPGTVETGMPERVTFGTVETGIPERVTLETTVNHEDPGMLEREDEAPENRETLETTVRPESRASPEPWQLPEIPETFAMRSERAERAEVTHLVDHARMMSRSKLNAD